MTNKEVYQRPGKTRGILKTLKTRKTKLITEQILCNNRLLSRIIKGIIEKKNSRDRPPLDYISQIVRDMNCISDYELKRKAKKHQQ